MARAIKFYRWSDRRKAKFVEYRLLGMHTHWAVFWALINRSAYRQERGYACFTPKEVDSICEMKDQHPWESWTQPMGANDRDKNLPPQSRFDALEKGGE